jgi:hypothetical protein
MVLPIMVGVSPGSLYGAHLTPYPTERAGAWPFHSMLPPHEWILSIFQAYWLLKLPTSSIIGAIFHQFPLNAQSLAPIMSNTVIYFPVLAVMWRSMLKKRTKISCTYYQLATFHDYVAENYQVEDFKVACPLPLGIFPI